MATQQKQFRLIASLSTKGVTAWVQLNEQNKWKKENLLAVFCLLQEERPLAGGLVGTAVEHSLTTRDTARSRYCTRSLDFFFDSKRL